MLGDRASSTVEDGSGSFNLPLSFLLDNIFLVGLMAVFTSPSIIMSSHQIFQWKIVRNKGQSYVIGRSEGSLCAQSSWLAVWPVKFSFERSRKPKGRPWWKHGWPGESSLRLAHCPAVLPVLSFYIEPPESSQRYLESDPFFLYLKPLRIN